MYARTGGIDTSRKSPEFLIQLYSSCAAKSSSIAGDDIAVCLLKVSSRGVRRVTRLVPLATACSKMLLSSLFFGAGCWLCLFSPFRTDHRKQLRTRSVATQQRLRTNSFAQLLGEATPLVARNDATAWAWIRHPSLRDQH